ncbi:unnamed protein product [Moneuplotes crassus]|uniref:Uncharacterized protein n=1 Tax=Euplotes crassus TaxID=5936 RepID=A0AAD1XTM3_EUPCR|nr:unnamed protein product [Moneuplotes crassus]
MKVSDQKDFDNKMCVERGVLSKEKALCERVYDGNSFERMPVAWGCGVERGNEVEMKVMNVDNIFLRSKILRKFKYSPFIRQGCYIQNINLSSELCSIKDYNLLFSSLNPGLSSTRRFNIYGRYHTKTKISKHFSEFIKLFSSLKGELSINCIRLEAMEFVKIILAASEVKKIIFDDCCILEGKVKRQLRGSSSLKSIIFSNSREITLGGHGNFVNYKEILRNISYCPCINSLTDITLSECNFREDQAKSIIRKYGFYSTKFILQNNSRSKIIP